MWNDQRLLLEELLIVYDESVVVCPLESLAKESRLRNLGVVFGQTMQTSRKTSRTNRNPPHGGRLDTSVLVARSPSRPVTGTLELVGQRAGRVRSLALKTSPEPSFMLCWAALGTPAGSI